jgi:hypothetical protein
MQTQTKQNNSLSDYPSWRQTYTATCQRLGATDLIAAVLIGNAQLNIITCCTSYQLSDAGYTANIPGIQAKQVQPEGLNSALL